MLKQLNAKKQEGILNKREPNVIWLYSFVISISAKGEISTRLK
jgi:hypothetical protein